jgi:sulfite dehydrogenase
MWTKPVLLRGALAALAFACWVLAAAVEIELPRDTVSFKESKLPGYQLVQRNCVACHSAHYVATQPPSARAYWETTVKKMKKPFGAQFDDADIAPMVDYLVKTYGTERPAPGKTPAALNERELRSLVRYTQAR